MISNNVKPKLELNSADHSHKEPARMHETVSAVNIEGKGTHPPSTNMLPENINNNIRPIHYLSFVGHINSFLVLVS